MIKADYAIFLPSRGMICSVVFYNDLSGKDNKKMGLIKPRFFIFIYCAFLPETAPQITFTIIIKHTRLAVTRH